MLILVNLFRMHNRETAAKVFLLMIKKLSTKIFDHFLIMSISNLQLLIKLLFS